MDTAVQWYAITSDTLLHLCHAHCAKCSQSCCRLYNAL